MLQEHMPVGLTLSTIVGEKSLDLIAVGLLIVLAVPISTLPDWFPSSSGITMGIMGLLLLVIINLIWIGRTWIKSVAQKALSFHNWLPDQWYSRAMRLVNTVLEGLGTLSGLKSALTVIVITILIWLLSIFTLIATLNAFNLPAAWYIALALSLAIYLSNLIPTPPALIGVISAITIMVLKWFDISESSAAALGLVLNIIIVAPLIVLGSWSIWVRFSTLAKNNDKGKWAWILGLKQ
jgi:uncharacterized protein (TIRG00374 family)